MRDRMVGVAALATFRSYLVGVVLLACSPSASLTDGCVIVQTSTGLPEGLEETSGVAASRDHPGILWTHNDSGGDPVVVGLRSDGGTATRVAVHGARAVDWEDLELAPCPAGTCLFIADTGNGDGRRSEIGIYRIPEPDPTSSRSEPAEYLPIRFPEGARDAEALFILPEGNLFLVTKGRFSGVELYRYPLPFRASETVTLEHVRTLAPDPRPLEGQVTGASAAPSGAWVAIRSYKRLQLWRTRELLDPSGTPSLTVDLTPLGEVQGEAVSLLDNGTVILTSEGGFPGVVGTIAVAQCDLEGDQPR